MSGPAPVAAAAAAGPPLEIIALEEVPPPPRGVHQTAPSDCSSVPSSSDYSESAPESAEDDAGPSSEDEDECSSYCSSDAGDLLEHKYTYTCGSRLDRVLAWRDNFAKAMGMLPADHHGQSRDASVPVCIS